MKIGLTQQNNKYGFVIVAEQNGLAMFDSFRDHKAVPFVEPEYSYAWEAQKDAQKILRYYDHHFKYANEDMIKPIVTDISAEEMLVNHYREIYDGLEDKTHGVKKVPQEERDKVYQEVKMVKKELETIIKQIEEEKQKKQLKRMLMLYRQLIRRNFTAEEAEDKKKEAEAPPMPAMPPPAPGGAPGGMPPLMASVIDPESDNTEILDLEAKRELMEHYGEKACQAIHHKCNGAHYVIGEDDSLMIFDSTNSPVLRLGVNEKLHVDKIIPVGKTSKICPYHTVEFYQKYWKPIVEEVGHFYIDDTSTLVLASLSSLPDTPKGNDVGVVEGWNTKDKRLETVEVAFRGDKPTWFFDAAKVEKIASASKYTEQDYLNSVVKCIDPKLESIFGRTGAVIQIIPYDDFIELDVKFGRGLGNVRLTEKQIEIVPV